MNLKLILATGLALSGMSHAQGPEPVLPLTREQAIARALEHNPDLLAAQWERARADIRLRYAGRLEDPELELEFQNDSFGEDEGEQRVGVALSQNLPLRPRRIKAKKLGQAQKDLSERGFTVLQLDVAHQVDTHMIQLILGRQKANTLRKQSAVNAEIKTILEQQAQRGEASQLDVTQAALTGNRLEREVAIIESENRRLQADLAFLIGYPSPSTLKGPDELKLPDHWQPPPFRKMERVNPDTQQALRQVEVAQATYDLERSQRWGDVQLKLFMEQEETVDAPDGLTENTLAGVGFSIPLPLFRRNSAAVQQAMVDRHLADEQCKNAASRWMNDRNTIAQACLDAYRLARGMTGETLTLARDHFQAIRQAYQQGQVGLVQVQRAQEQVLELEIQTLDATQQFFIEQANLRRIMADYHFMKENS